MGDWEGTLLYIMVLKKLKSGYKFLMKNVFNIIFGFPIFTMGNICKLKLNKYGRIANEVLSFECLKVRFPHFHFVQWRVLVSLVYHFRGRVKIGPLLLGVYSPAKILAEENSNTLMILYLIIIQDSSDGKMVVGADHCSQQLSSLLHSGQTRTPVLMSGISAPVCVRLNWKNSTR